MSAFTGVLCFTGDGNGAVGLWRPAGEDHVLLAFVCESHVAQAKAKDYGVTRLLGPRSERYQEERRWPVDVE